MWSRNEPKCDYTGGTCRHIQVDRDEPRGRKAEKGKKYILIMPKQGNVTYVFVSLCGCIRHPLLGADKSGAVSSHVIRGTHTSKLLPASSAPPQSSKYTARTRVWKSLQVKTTAFVTALSSLLTRSFLALASLLPRSFLAFFLASVLLGLANSYIVRIPQDYFKPRRANKPTASRGGLRYLCISTNASVLSLPALGHIVFSVVKAPPDADRLSPRVGSDGRPLSRWIDSYVRPPARFLESTLSHLDG